MCNQLFTNALVQQAASQQTRGLVIIFTGQEANHQQSHDLVSFNHTKPDLSGPRYNLWTHTRPSGPRYNLRTHTRPSGPRYNPRTHTRSSGPRYNLRTHTRPSGPRYNPRTHTRPSGPRYNLRTHTRSGPRYI